MEARGSYLPGEQMRIYTEQPKEIIEFEDAKFHCVILSEEEKLAINNRNTKIQGRGPAAQKVHDEMASLKEFFFKTVQNWEGVENHKGVTLECNDTNKNWLFQYRLIVANHIIVESKRIAEERLGAEIKN